jgi:SnoaL-like domain
MTTQSASGSFTVLLAAFAEAVQANDGQRLAALFTPDGIYEDGFFGVHTGRAAIAAMLQRFHDTGSSYFWEFLDPVSDGATGYARFRFSYASRLPESIGRPVLFEGNQLLAVSRRANRPLLRSVRARGRSRPARLSGRACQAHPREDCGGPKPTSRSSAAPRLLLDWVRQAGLAAKAEPPARAGPEPSSPSPANLSTTA